MTSTIQPPTVRAVRATYYEPEPDLSLALSALADRGVRGEMVVAGSPDAPVPLDEVHHQVDSTPTDDADYVAVPVTTRPGLRGLPGWYSAGRRLTQAPTDDPETLARALGLGEDRLVIGAFPTSGPNRHGERTYMVHVAAPCPRTGWAIVRTR